MKNNRSSALRESEAALIIRSDDALRIAREIAQLERVGNYRLARQPTQRIRDILFDTPARDLQKQKLALRIRRVNGKNLLTLKGASRKNKWGGNVRMEIELPWSRAAFARVLRELKSRGISLALRGAFDARRPIVVMQRAGLTIVQDRSTHRQIRDVMPLDGASNAVLAEMAIDSVSFHFEKRSVRIYEVEIESKHDGARLGTVVDALARTYKPALHPTQSKLAIGSALGAMLAAGTLQKWLKPDRTLRRAGFDRMIRMLANV